MTIPSYTQDQAGPSRSTADSYRTRQLVSLKRREVSTPKAKPEPIPYKPSADPETDEQAAVHEVYERIAPHFSQTRHKPWPLISSFLHSLPPHSIGLDSGGGNGKYVPVAREASVSLVVMDRSLGLLGDARKQPGFGYGITCVQGEEGEEKAVGQGYVDSANAEEGLGRGECVRGDLTSIGWRRGVFDFAISIAAIHHLSTPERRRRSVQALIYPLVHTSKPPYSRFLIYVWAYEQSDKSKRKMGATAKDTPTSPAKEPPTTEPGSEGAGETADQVVRDRQAEKGTGEERIQDVLVPWVLQNRTKAKSKYKLDPNHTLSPNSHITESESTTGKAQENSEPEPEHQVFHRYYHLFIRKELRELVEQAIEQEGYVLRDNSDLDQVRGDGKDERVWESGQEEGEGRRWCRVVKEGWEADNWWLEGEVGLY